MTRNDIVGGAGLAYIAYGNFQQEIILCAPEMVQISSKSILDKPENSAHGTRFKNHKPKPTQTVFHLNFEPTFKNISRKSYTSDRLTCWLRGRKMNRIS